MLQRLPDNLLRHNYVKQCAELTQLGFITRVKEPNTAKILLQISLSQHIRWQRLADFSSRATKKTSNGKSVNDIQYTRNKLQQDLMELLIKFCHKLVGFIGDISKTYFNIRVHPNDIKFQRTFIGNAADKPLVEMELPTVTFGMKFFPFLALRTMLQNSCFY